jgi:hypothetical protein
MKTLVTALFMGSIFASAAFADSWRCDRRETDRRIWSGERSGRLTPREAARLEHQQRQLNRQYLRDRWDGGGLSYSERRRLERRQDQLDRRVTRELWDRDRRW